MKLELKHLAGYLPYGLKCLAQGECEKFFDMQGITDFTDVDLHETGRTVSEQYDIEDVFPILRPLSDLTKEIEVNGEKFVPSTLGLGLPLDDLTSEEILKLKYTTVNKLLSWHFDIYGLIENGLAIDIKTL